MIVITVIVITVIVITGSRKKVTSLMNGFYSFQRSRILQALHHRGVKGLPVLRVGLPRRREHGDGVTLRQSHHGELARLLAQAVLQSSVSKMIDPHF